MRSVTVALPVLNAGPLLDDVLTAVRGQKVDCELDLLIADSGSKDGSREVARSHGARVLEVEEFGHGRTRNMLLESSTSDFVALITQDAVPADERWLAQLVAALDEVSGAGLAYGPYLPREDATPMVRRELNDFFAGIGTSRRVDRDTTGLDKAGFFTSANCCIARWAWERVPFADVPYAEDRLLALQMLEQGIAKVYEPAAGVVHSHDYPPGQRFGRWFDEWRALREVYGHREPLDLQRAGALVKRGIRGDLALVRSEGVHGVGIARQGIRSLGYHGGRWVAAVSGSRADLLPRRLRRRLSLEGRETFEPR